MNPYYSDDWLTVYGGDCRTVVRELPAESVHTVITSPPYWGLRDYGQTGQLGLEQTPEEYVAAMVDVFREVRRILRSDGTVWLNLGDSYASGSANRDGSNGYHDGRTNRDKRHSVGPVDGLKPKDLVGIPWRVAFALQADGWYLRSDIIWSKPNPMPESVTDRPTKSHEYLFLLAKSARYFFDADAVREGSLTEVWPGIGPKHGTTDRHRSDYEPMTVNAGRNIRSVWTIATAPYPGAHFATFPPRLVEPCVKAGTSERGVCPECGAPWERVVEREERPERRAAERATPRNDGDGWRTADGGVARRGGWNDQTTGWRPTCKHDAEPVAAVVLDPFAGTGTVGMVAQSLSRRAVLIDLNPDYLRQCLARNAQTPLGLMEEVS